MDDQHGLATSVEINVTPWPKPREQLKLKSVTANKRGEREVSEGDILVWRTIDWGGWKIFHTCFKQFTSESSISINHWIPYMRLSEAHVTVLHLPRPSYLPSVSSTSVHLSCPPPSCHPWDIGLHTNSFFWTPF